jgi:hypothetical protein
MLSLFCSYNVFIVMKFVCSNLAGMLFSYAIEGFLGWDGWPEGWVDGWAVCEVWADGWAEGEGKGGI